MNSEAVRRLVFTMRSIAWGKQEEMLKRRVPRMVPFMFFFSIPETPQYTHIDSYDHGTIDALVVAANKLERALSTNSGL